MSDKKRMLASVVPPELGGMPLSEELPDAVSTEEITVVGITLKMERLKDGRRVVESTGMDLLLAYVAGGGAILASESDRVQRFLKGLDADKKIIQIPTPEEIIKI